MKRTLFTLVVVFGLLAFTSTGVLAQQATHRDFRYIELKSDTVNLTAGGDTAEMTFSNPANKLIVMLDDGETETVNVATGTDDADTTGFPLIDEEGKRSRTLDNVRVDALNFFRNAGKNADSNGVTVRVWAWEYD